jgi:hypothetical protein
VNAVGTNVALGPVLCDKVEGEMLHVTKNGRDAHEIRIENPLLCELQMARAKQYKNWVRKKRRKLRRRSPLLSLCSCGIYRVFVITIQVSSSGFSII